MSSRRPKAMGEAWRAVSMQVRARSLSGWSGQCDRGPGKRNPPPWNEVMVISEAGYSPPRHLGGHSRGTRPGMPGLYPNPVAPSGRPILLCVLAAGAVKQPRCFGCRRGRLFATRRLWAPSSREYSSSRLQGPSDIKLISLVSTIATETFGEMRV